MAPISAASRAPTASGGRVWAAPSSLSWYMKLVRSELRPWSCNTSARAPRSPRELVLSTSCSLTLWAEVAGEGSCAPAAAGAGGSGTAGSHGGPQPGMSGLCCLRTALRPLQGWCLQDHWHLLKGFGRLPYGQGGRFGTGLQSWLACWLQRNVSKPGGHLPSSPTAMVTLGKLPLTNM